MALVSIPVDGCNLEVCEDVRKSTTQEGEEDWNECGEGGGQMVRWRAGSGEEENKSWSQLGH